MNKKPNDEGWGRGEHPVINVSWYDAIEYCNWLSEKEGIQKAYNNASNLLDKNGKLISDNTEVFGYRLLTEAEWEFVASGGNESNGYKYSGSKIPSEVAWYIENSKGQTIEVSTKNPINKKFMI
jgi:formylglycine-generating enzyme required for sulfatase activity